MRRKTVFLLLLSSAACSPTKGYVGPDLPEERLSIVKYDSDTADIDVDGGTANGVSFGGSGISLLPGRQSYELRIDITGEKGPCDAYASFDSSGFRDCQKKNDHCNCETFVTVHERCQVSKRRGSCAGAVETLMGREYRLVVEGSWYRVTARPTETKGQQVANTVECGLDSPRTEESDETLGTGPSYTYRLSSYENPCSGW